MAEDNFSMPEVRKKRIGSSGTASSPAPHPEPSISSVQSDTGSHPTVDTDVTDRKEANSRSQTLKSASIATTNPRRQPRKISKNQEQKIIELRKLGLSYCMIASHLGLRACGVWALMKRRGLTGPKKTRPISRELLEELYWKQGLSRQRIAKVIGMPKTNVEYWMKKQGIPSRSLLKYPRHQFEGDICGKAYILGLCRGDLYPVRFGHGVSVSTTTTHPAMLELFRKTFGNYGHIYTRPVYNLQSNAYQWHIRVSLDESFSFLLQRLDELPRWVTENSNSFLHFLAGFFDAEGFITPVFRERYGRWKVVEVTIAVTNSNKQLLEQIARMMKGYHPRIALTQKGGTPTSRHGRIRKNDQWRVVVGRRAAQETLVTELPLRHQEKIDRASLVLDILKGCRWEDARKRFRALRQKVREDVTALARLAVLQDAGNNSESH